MTDEVTELPTRRSQEPLKVRALPHEREVLRQKAEAAGLSVSAYLLTAGLGAALPARPSPPPDPERIKTDRVRRAQSYLKVRPLPDERAELEKAAAMAGMPLSEFLLSAGLGATIKSVVDLEQVAELSQVNADLGRLGGLLKLWLSKEGRFVPGYPDAAHITALLDRIRVTQEALDAVVRRILDSH